MEHTTAQQPFLVAIPCEDVSEFDFSRKFYKRLNLTPKQHTENNDWFRSIVIKNKQELMISELGLRFAHIDNCLIIEPIDRTKETKRLAETYFQRLLEINKTLDRSAFADLLSEITPMNTASIFEQVLDKWGSFNENDLDSVNRAGYYAQQNYTIEKYKGKYAYSSKTLEALLNCLDGIENSNEFLKELEEKYKPTYGDKAELMNTRFWRIGGYDYGS